MKSKASKISSMLDEEVAERDDEDQPIVEQSIPVTQVEDLKSLIDKKMDDYQNKMQDKVKETYEAIYEVTKDKEK